jgi:hypothetical protein
MKSGQDIGETSQNKKWVSNDYSTKFNMQLFTSSLTNIFEYMVVRKLQKYFSKNNMILFLYGCF